jgi:hypothetical protein
MINEMECKWNEIKIEMERKEILSSLFLIFEKIGIVR